MKQAAEDILAVLSRPKPALPYLRQSDNLRQGIEETAKLLNRALPRPELPVPDPSPTSSKNSPAVPVTPSEPPGPRSQVIPPDTPGLPRVPVTKNRRANNPRLPRVDLHSGPHLIQHLTRNQVPVKPRIKIKNPFTNFKELSLHHLLATELFLPHMHHVYNKHTGRRESAETLLTGPNRDIWNKAVSNEIGRLAKCNQYSVEFTDTIEFIAKNQVPSGRKVTYAQFIFDHRPLKEESHRARLVAGGDKLMTQMLLHQLLP